MCKTCETWKTEHGLISFEYFTERSSNFPLTGTERRTSERRVLHRVMKMRWKFYEICNPSAKFMLFKLSIVLCMVHGYTRSEKEKLSEYKFHICFTISVIML